MSNEMSIFEYKFGFHSEMNLSNNKGKFVYTHYIMYKDCEDNGKELEGLLNNDNKSEFLDKLKEDNSDYAGKFILAPDDPPNTFNHVIFDILQENTEDSTEFTIKSQVAYVFVDKPEEKDVMCFDAIVRTDKGKFWLLSPRLWKRPREKFKEKSKVEKPKLESMWKRLLGKFKVKGEEKTIVPASYLTSDGDDLTDKNNNSNKVFTGDIYDNIITSFKDGKTNAKKPLRTRDNGTPKWWHKSGFITYTCTVRKTEKCVTFKGEYTLRRNILGEAVGAVPIPKFPEDSCIPVHSIVVASWCKGKNKDDKEQLRLSKEALDNLLNLSRHLQFRDMQVTWIMGDPGSGKEIIFEALHYGSVISRLKNFEKRSAAGVTLDELNKHLFLAKHNEHHGKCLIERLNDGGSIFLDEFDKVAQKKEIYGSMLRVLEAKEYIKKTVNEQGWTSEETEKCKKVNWIFAGAFSQSDPRKTVPLDLWSRLTGFILIKNPLLNDLEYAATLFIYFYLIETIKLVRHKENSVKDFFRIIEKGEDLRLNERVIHKLLDIQHPITANEPFKPSESLFNCAFKFADHVRTFQVFPDDRIDSSRSIRQAARVTFFKVLNEAIGKEGSFNFDDAMKEGLKSAKETILVARGP